jgi:hypothetical protein
MTRKILTFILLLPFLCEAQDAGVESVFDQGLGGRAMGMAGAFAAVADDSSAVYWNPAGLGYLQAAEVSGLFGFFPFGTLYNGVSACYPSTGFGTVAIGFLRIGTGDLTFRDARNVVLDPSARSGQMQMLLGYGNRLPGLPVSLGIGLKLNSVSIGELSDVNISLDSGILIRAYGPEWTRFMGRYTLENLTMGFCFKDLLSSSMRFKAFEEAEAFGFKWGAAWRGAVKGDPNHRILVSADLNLHSRKAAKIALGAEYNLYRMFFFRTGFNQVSGFVLGAGVYYSFSGQRFRLDYSVCFQEFGPVHKISLLYQFGRTVEQRLEDVKQAEDKSLKLKIGQAVDQERAANEGRIRQIEADYSNTLRKRQDELEAKRRDELAALMQSFEATNKARVARINEENRLKLEKELAAVTNALGQQSKDKIEQLKRDAEKQRLEDLRQNEVKAQQDLTNQRKVLQQAQQEEIDRKIRTEKARADQEKKKAIQEEQRRSAEREQKIKTEQKAIGQDLLQAKGLLNDSGDFDGAIRILEGILRRDPANREAGSLLEQARSAKVPPESAPLELRTALNAGAQFYSQGQYGLAIQTWEKALEKYPNNWHLLTSIRKAKERLPAEQGQAK